MSPQRQNASQQRSCTNVLNSIVLMYTSNILKSIKEDPWEIGAIKFVKTILIPYGQCRTYSHVEI